MKLRPLPVVSDFVVDQMPGLLEDEDPQWFRRRVTHVAEEADWYLSHAAFDGQDRRVLLLDLLMIQAAMHTKKQTCPRELSSAIARLLGRNEAPIITYELLVLDNPETDMRAFTRGPVGETEKAFYNAHRTIEHALTPVIASVDTLLSWLEGSADGAVLSPDVLIGILKPICGSFESPALRLMPGGNTDTGHFAQFRPYFMSMEVGGKKIRGPSGAFSGQMPLLEILFRGDSPSKNSQVYVDLCSEYFPVRHRERLHEAIMRAKDGRILTNFAARDKLAAQYVNILDRFFYDFRLNHLRAVYSQIRNQVRDKEEGTGGFEDIRTFLKDRLGEEPDWNW
ncbi:MAG TPA: hypothetical protein VEB18_03795 [Candidatus Paceibacterota bacterium]|nr:hypothetical protein [Candidatus Paceibacterota bacterium]